MVAPLFCGAQFAHDSQVPHYRYSATAGLGGNLLNGDLKNKRIGPSAYLRGAYFVRHGIQVGAELQGGVLRAEDAQVTGGIVRRTLNQYYAGIIDVRFQPYRFFQKDHVRRNEPRQSLGKKVLHSVYAGAGVGAIYNQQWDRERPQDAEKNSPHYGADQGLSLLFSTNLGFEVPLHKLDTYRLDSYIWSIVVNGQANFAFDDEVDGYSGQYSENTSKDVFGVLSIGVNLRF